MWAWWVCCGMALTGATAQAEKPTAGLRVDAGTFLVLEHGTAIARESFTVTSVAEGSITESTIRVLDGSKGEQRFRLELAGDGGLRRYEWHEAAPGRGHLLLAPDGAFLKQQVGTKTEENIGQSYVLTASTVVLDNNFFILRELLIWRYLREFCQPEAGHMACPAKEAPISHLPAVVPLHHYSMQVAIRLEGPEKVALGASPALHEVELLRFAVEDDTGQWLLWVDSQYRLQRLMHAGETIEILREDAASGAR